jgi:hypothetical protein
MKTNYIAPSTKIVAVKPHLLDATSILTISGDNAQVIVTEPEGGYNGEFFSRRGGSIWDDED